MLHTETLSNYYVVGCDGEWRWMAKRRPIQHCISTGKVWWMQTSLHAISKNEIQEMIRTLQSHNTNLRSTELQKPPKVKSFTVVTMFFSQICMSEVYFHLQPGLFFVNMDIKIVSLMKTCILIINIKVFPQTTASVLLMYNYKSLRAIIV